MSSIIRVKKTNNYTVLNNTVLNDKTLSWKAKGLHSYMLSKPDNWKFHVVELQKRATDGRDSITTAIKELTEKGYMKRVRKQDNNGKFDWHTVVYEVPQDFKPLTGKPLVEKPSTGKPLTEKPSTDNPQLLSTDVVSTEELSTDVVKHIVRGLFDHYLSKNIINHSKLTGPMERAAKARLKDYSQEEIIQAIDNYAIVYHGNEYYFKQKYTFADLMRDKDVRKFINDADPLNNFIITKNNFKGRGKNAINQRSAEEYKNRFGF